MAIDLECFLKSVSCLNLLRLVHHPNTSVCYRYALDSDCSLLSHLHLPWSESSFSLEVLGRSSLLVLPAFWDLSKLAA